MGPSSTAPRVTGITPSTGTTLGGTAVTISGANFASGATVTIGGVAATNVVVGGPTTLTATTPQHASATSDIVVAVAGRSGTLARGYTFVAPAMVVNQPPSVGTITARSSAPRKPAQYSSLGESVNVSAAVSDAESAVSEMTLTWSSDVGGTFSGSGPNVTWTAPGELAGTPRTATLTLTVTERYATTDTSGLPVTAENRVTGTSAVRVHDSIKEVSDLASQFLVDFSRQVAPAIVMRNFTSSCPGTADELGDVLNNQRNFIITSYTVGTPRTTADFTGRCPFRAVRGDACAIVPVEWFSTIKSTGRPIWTRGFDQVTAVLENDQWKLCASDYDETAASPLMPQGLRFKR